MRKKGFYVLLWTIYYLAIVFVEVDAWRQDLPSLSLFEIYKKTALSCLMFISAQLLFFYYLIFFWLEKVIDDNQLRGIKIVELVFSYLFIVFVKRLMAVYISQPLIYELGPPVAKNIFEVRYVFTSMLFLSFPIGISIAVEFLSFKVKNLQREKELLREKLTTELTLLSNRLNPHFLFNTLNNIYSLSRKKSELTSEAILKLSELLSFMLYESGKGRITLKQEIAFINDYIGLERLRYGSRLNFTFDLSVDDVHQLISPLLLLPVLENAFKHGSAQSLQDSSITVRLQVSNGVLDFHSTNSFDYQLNYNSEGIGLKSLKRKLELLYTEHRIDIQQEENLFHVHIHINLNKYEEI